MKQKSVFLFLLLFIHLIYSEEAVVEKTRRDSSYGLITDRHYSPYAGAEDLLFGHKVIDATEDRIFPNLKKTPFLKEGVLRGLELVLFWDPLNSLTTTVQHEVFGHGYRLRDLGRNKAQDINYKFDRPFPYFGERGRKWALPIPFVYTWSTTGAATSYSFSESFSFPDNILTAIGGIEAQEILARSLKMKWLAGNQMNARASSLYYQSEQSLFLYSHLTGKKDPFCPSNDLMNYVASVKLLYPSGSLSTQKLRNLSWINFLDPFTFYSVQSWFVYLFYGKDTAPYLITLNDSIQYLPNIRMALAPYGLEYYLENFFVINGKAVYSYLKGGKFAGNSYFGLGVDAKELISTEFGNFGFQTDIWKQPNFLAQKTSLILFLEELKNQTENEPESVISPSLNIPAINRGKWGFCLSLAGSWAVEDTYFLYTELGFKTEGYLPGYSVEKSPVARLGIKTLF
jgi:hypothetical protein